MFDFDEKIHFPYHSPAGHFPPEKPRYTMSEELLHTEREMKETIARLLKFEERLQCKFDDMLKHITSDNVIFKNTFAESHRLFLESVKNEINVFEGNVDSSLTLFKETISSDYAHLSEEVKSQITTYFNDFVTKLNGYKTELNTTYDEFRDSVENRIDQYNSASVQAHNDFVTSVNVKFATIEAKLNADYKTFVNQINASISEFKNNWAETIDARLDGQDSTIADAVLYMKTNFNVSVENLLNELIDNEGLSGVVDSTIYKVAKQIGATGDGVTDDTKAIENLLSNGGNVLLTEGVYIVNRPLYVNVNTTTFNGTSSRCILKAGDKFPNGESIVTFYSPKGDYYSRPNRSNKHGNFAVIGKDKNCDGVRFGGKVGTDYEGHVESSLFTNIFVDNCNVAFTWGAHVYHNTLIQCDSHSNNYALKTADDITDTGEVFTCINCGFWSGSLFLADCGEIMFNSCTVHTKTSQVVDGLAEVGHYFKNTFASFQNCHFEAILKTDEEKSKMYAPQFYALNSLVYLTECSAVVSSDSLMNFTNHLFVDTSDNGRSHGIFVKGGQWKYYFGRVRPSVSLCKGSVKLTEISLKYVFDGVTIPYKIYDTTPDFNAKLVNEWGKFDVVYGDKTFADRLMKTVEIIAKEQDGGAVAEETGLDGASSIMLTVKTTEEEILPNTIGFYKKIDVSNLKTCIINGNIMEINHGVKSTLISNSDSPSLIMFQDIYGNFIDWGDPINVDLFSQSEVFTENTYQGAKNSKLTVNGRFISIPSNAKYALIGFDLRADGNFTKNTDGTYSFWVLHNLRFEFI